MQANVRTTEQDSENIGKTLHHTKISIMYIDALDTCETLHLQLN